MNRLVGKIIGIQSTEALSLVDIAVAGDVLAATILETPETSDYLRVGRSVNVVFKETEVALARDLSGRLSMRNRLRCTVSHIEKGKVLSRILLDYQGNRLVSIITTRSAESLELAAGLVVDALIKANELSLMGLADGD